MGDLKDRRLTLRLSSHPALFIGECVPFYFCPRSVMLYILHKANHPNLSYSQGQQPIVHLELDMHACVQWAKQKKRRWAFTTGNAAAYTFQDYSDLADLSRLNWTAIDSHSWSDPVNKEGKQAEFLLEEYVPFGLIDRIGVINTQVEAQINGYLKSSSIRPEIEVLPDWYY